VQFAGDQFVLIQDPKKRKPFLTPLQRAMFRDGNVISEDLVGDFKDNSFTSGNQIIPENTDPLQQGNPDPVITEIGAPGHFVSTVEDEREVAGKKMTTMTTMRMNNIMPLQ
jgi:hypothetical protein